PSIRIASIIRPIDLTIDHVEESIFLIVGMASQDGISLAVKCAKRAALQTNEVEQIDGVEIELEVAVVVQHLQRNRHDHQCRKEEAVQIVGPRKSTSINVATELQKAQLLVRTSNKRGADRAVRHGDGPVVSTQKVQQERCHRCDVSVYLWVSN